MKGAFGADEVIMSGGLLMQRLACRRPDPSRYLRSDSRRKRVGRVRIDIWAQLVRRYLPSDRFRKRSRDVGWRYFALDRIQPTPDVGLSNLRIRANSSNFTRQACLSAGDVDCFL